MGIYKWKVEGRGGHGDVDDLATLAGAGMLSVEAFDATATNPKQNDRLVRADTKTKFLKNLTYVPNFTEDTSEVFGIIDIPLKKPVVCINCDTILA